MNSLSFPKTIHFPCTIFIIVMMKNDPCLNAPILQNYMHMALSVPLFLFFLVNKMDLFCQLSTDKCPGTKIIVYSSMDWGMTPLCDARSENYQFLLSILNKIFLAIMPFCMLHLKSHRGASVIIITIVIIIIVGLTMCSSPMYYSTPK